MNISYSKPDGILKKLSKDYLNLGVQCVLFGLGFFLYSFKRSLKQWMVATQASGLPKP